MKTTSKAERKPMRSEYRFDYGKARPNRFAGRGLAKTIVMLDPDVARVFKNAESVNGALRALLAAIPARRTRDKEKRGA